MSRTQTITISIMLLVHVAVMFKMYSIPLTGSREAKVQDTTLVVGNETRGGNLLLSGTVVQATEKMSRVTCIVYFGNHRKVVFLCSF